MRLSVVSGSALALATASLLVLCARSAFADDLVWTPARSGQLGAWLAARPGPSTAKLFAFTQADDSALGPLPELREGSAFGRSSALRLVTSGQSHFDLRKDLSAGGKGAVAVFAGVLRVSEPCRVRLVLGVDDAVSVRLDGKTIYVRDVERPLHHDDDSVSFALSAGDHGLWLGLRQYSGAWNFRARLLNEADLLPARQVQWVLPNAQVSSQASLVQSLASVDLSLELFADRYRPQLSVRYPGGLPASAQVPVSVEVQAGSQTLYRVSLGQVSVGPRSVLDLSAQLPDILASQLGDRENEGTLSFRVQLGEQSLVLTRPMRAPVRRCIGRIDETLAKLDQLGAQLKDPAVVRATLELERSRLQGFVSSADKDMQATVEEAASVEAFLDRLGQGKDPLLSQSGATRLAYAAPWDQKPRPFGLYVPPSFSKPGGAGKKYPLVVVLHGLNGEPLQMMRWFFGGDDPGRPGSWEDRHVGSLPELDAFVVSPSGYGNYSYREVGERDVMYLRDWVAKTFPIDSSRVYVTGPSMGGTGTGAMALRYPDRFAAAAPLCGYHSYFLRADMAGRKLRPWEQAEAEFWSNVFWAENGLHTPLYIVHGTRDLPTQNSGVLIDRYKRLGYRLLEEHPEEGHSVWPKTYDDFKAYRWLHQFQREAEPKDVLLKTASLRYADNAWVHITALEQAMAWGTVKAEVSSSSQLRVTSAGVLGLQLDRPASRLDASKPLQVSIDGQSLEFSPSEPVLMHRQGTSWAKGAAQDPGLSKKRGLSGPIRDAFLEPLLFVYGTQDPSQARLNYEVAKALAEPPFGVEARWPVLADSELTDQLAATHAVFLVGNARSNSYLASIEDKLPIRLEGKTLVAGSKRFDGPDLGTLFVYPNPKHPDRYVVVLEGADPSGTLRALSLPRMLPDFVIYDSRIAGGRGQIVLGSFALLAGGQFDAHWQLPQNLSDPVAKP